MNYAKAAEILLGYAAGKKVQLASKRGVKVWVNVINSANHQFDFINYNYRFAPDLPSEIWLNVGQDGSLRAYRDGHDAVVAGSEAIQANARCLVVARRYVDAEPEC